jgi:hypothetical protein
MRWEEVAATRGGDAFALYESNPVYNVCVGGGGVAAE